VRRCRRPGLGAAAVAGPAFVGVFTVGGARRADYEPLRHPVSSLAIGPRGGVQRANFAILGLSYLGLSWCLGAAPGPDPDHVLISTRVVIAAAGLGRLVSAAAETDPVSGYPPGTPDQVAQPTRRGQIHDLGALPVFIGIPVASLISAVHGFRDRQPRWAAWSLAAGSVGLATLGFSVAAFAQHPRFARWGGLFQRSAIVSCLGWLTSVAIRARGTSKHSERSRPWWR
jgi:uncharacterized protein DUF998